VGQDLLFLNSFAYHFSYFYFVIFGRCTCTNCTEALLWSHLKFGLPRWSKTCRYRWPSVDLRPLACWDFGFESRRRHGCLSLVSVVCCQVEVSASGWLLVQRSPTGCGVSECDHENWTIGGQGLLWLSSYKKVRPTRPEAEAQLLQSIQNFVVVISATSGGFRRGQPVTDLSCGGLRPGRVCSLCSC